MSGIQEPAFTSQVTEWLSDKDNVPVLDDLQKDIAVRQSEIIAYLASQKHLRPRLEKIPGFWPWTLSRSATFARACTSEKDWDCLSYLKDMEFVVDPRDYRAFDVVFHFAENPYFTNPSLTKSYVATSGPTRGLTASELIGRARPSDLSTIPDDIGEKIEEKHTVVKAPEGEEWDVKKVQEETGEEVKLANTFFDEMDDLFGLSTEIKWKSDEMNLCKLFPRDEPDAEDENDFDAGDRGSFFHFFTEQVDADGLASMLWQDILPNCVAYFEGNGADNESDADDSMDEEDMEDDMLGEIDLVSESDEDELASKPVAKKQGKEDQGGRAAKRVKTQ
ncbi:hypothetical protein FFLO_02898 [Filobasidium floriforme]|uniref:Uncharacterized protein n=1 Tax=Filobasidium floriforme TaxID=5210 RepID=A0A8K0JME9_9TREE|nr:hypothetical protein FFLO_02898 [Filobasidium floriforme]